MLPFCGAKSPRRYGSSTNGNGQSSKANTPLLIHFDVNKTIIQSDSIQMKSIEEGVREGISELFWGHTRRDGDKLQWEWSRAKPSCGPPTDDVVHAGMTLTTYQQYCKEAIKVKAEAKEAIRSFRLVEGQPVRAEMEKLLGLTMKRMQLPPNIKYTKEAEAAGVKGATYNMFPTLFHLVASLQRSRRPFAIIFRSFGADHENIKTEWNAFCELRHPTFSSLIEDIGPMDGSVAGIPDRRIHGLHTLYRDAQGPVLVLHTFTNGPTEATWDSWAKSKPKPKADTRNGREYIDKVLKAKTVDGLFKLQKWMKDFLMSQGTTAIKDDWAWWQFSGETAAGGKLMTLIGGKPPTQQIFYDDNIDYDDARIVDCRDVNGQSMPSSKTLNKLCVKVNPVEALLDDDYFFRKLLHSQGDHLDVGASLMGLQKQLTDAEEERGMLMKQISAMGLQLKNLTEENRRMKLQRRIVVRDEGELHNVLAKNGVDLASFEQGGYRSLADLFAEIESGQCWLEMNEQNQVVRVLDMLFLKIAFKDMLLIESHEQDSTGKITTRNYLPGVKMTLKDTSVQAVLDRWFETGLQVNLKKCIETEMMPVSAPEAPPQQTSSSQAYPLPCIVQQSQGTFSIPDREVELNKDLLAQIGLPGGKHFTTTEKDGQGVQTRFWRWDKLATFQASATQGVKGAAGVSPQNVAETCEKLFKGHPRAETYKKLLLEMFDSFEAQKLCGGFSGSVVIRVQPFEADGRKGEPCIVKLDAGDAIEEEFQNSANVFEALPDRAARILGDAVYAKTEKGERLGAMRLELAGACWNVPELAQGSANLLSTFKDLLLYEGEQVFMGSQASTGDVRPFGNVNSVLAETFGPGGVVSSLRKGGKGLRRHEETPLLWGWYTLKGKEGKFNPLTAKKGEYPPEPSMRKLYKDYFGGEMPDLKHIVVNTIKPKLENLAGKSTGEMYPLVGLAHGDLNAANIMIDALDAVWLIDFATSVDLPLFTDMCKFEMACLFEYAAIPVTPKVFLEFASTSEEKWEDMNVGDWLRVDQPVVIELLKMFVALGNERLANISQSDLDKLIEEVAIKSGKAPHKQRGMVRTLRARLCADPAYMDAAFSYCASISNMLLNGEHVVESLEIKGIPLPDGRGSRGALSLRYFMDLCVSVRKFMAGDISGVLREQGKVPDGLQPCDMLSLQLWLPFLRESYRILGYRDIAPQYKLWSMYHCKKCAEKVQQTLEYIQKSQGKLAATPLYSKVRQELESRKSAAQQQGNASQSNFEGLQATSRWALHFASLFPTVDGISKVVRSVHRECPAYSDVPGLYAPIWEVTTTAGQRCAVDFASQDEPKDRSSSMQALDLIIDDPTTEVPPGAVRPTITVGQVMPNKKKEAPTIVLKSRLFYLTIEHLKQKAKAPATNEKLPDSSLTLHQWSNGKLSDEKLVNTRHGGSGSGEKAAQIFHLFHTVEATARDLSGRESMKLSLELGIPVFCYPPGVRLCVDTSGEGHSQVSAPSIIVTDLNSETGCYLTSLGNEVEFDPVPANHAFPHQVRYPVGQALILKQDGGAESGWLDAEVKAIPAQGSGYKYKVQLKGSDPKDAKSVDRYLDGMTSGRAMPGLTAAVFEEEIHKIKAFFRARHSFVVDALSGARLNVKECAPPTLSLKSSSMMDVGSDPSRIPSAKRGSTGTGPGVTSIMSQGSGSGSEAGAASSRFGWPTILASLESFEKGTPLCQPNAFLVLGSPGSGKSCLINRVIMESLDRYMNLVPIMIPVSEIVRRSGQDLDLSNPTRGMVQDWFDRYLRVTYGEDSNRYWMICQAMNMRRVAFLFEGLEDGNTLMKAVEATIKHLILDGHFVIVTSRPLLGGESSLEEMADQIYSLQLENLSDEHKRAVARRRLGPEGVEGFDRLFRRLRESQAPTEQGQDQAVTDSEQDVFGNPMMLSMLLCYLQTMMKKEAERLAEGGEEEEATQDGGATLTAVYRVALDVMLNRVQSRQQSERHHKEQNVQRCKHILEKMSLHMQLKRKLEILPGEAEKMVPKECEQVWTGLHSAVVAGHAMFLRLTQDGGQTCLKFLVKGFQNFFAAQAVVNGSDKDLPGLQELLTDPWWAQMLEMLAEARPHRYIDVIENRLKTFQPQEGESFLHIAARAGHRPIFQLLKLLHENNRKALFTKSKDLRTPLHVAAEKGNTGLCELMLEANASLDAEDANERLAMHVAMQHGAFQTAKFLMQRWSEQFGGQDRSYRPKKRENKAEKLAQRILNGSVDEKEFKEAAGECFVELQYFSDAQKIDKLRTWGGLLAVYWITANHYSLFVRSQAENARLSKRSWDSLQDWTRRTVGLTKNAQLVGAMLVFVDIMNLGKIKAFQKAFAPEFDEATEALHHILQKAPLVIPSFSNLNEDMQQMILSALKADFNFGQFLQAENLPASLNTVKQILGEENNSSPQKGSRNILGFFLFKIFAAMCGILGVKSLEGSLFMMDKNYTNFKVGLDVLQHLMDESAEQVYDRFLARRAENQNLSFSPYNPEARARVRLACLTRVMDPAGGKQVAEAFSALDGETQKKLMDFVNKDGITEKPGLLMYNLPNLLEAAAKPDSKIGLTLAMQVLLNVYEAANKEYKKTEKAVVSIFVDELVDYVKQPNIDAETFAFVKFEIVRAAGQKAESQGMVHISPWQLVTDDALIQGYAQEGATLSHDVLRSGMREPGFLKRIQTVFPEIQYMTVGAESDDVAKAILKETLCAMLVVYWTASDQAEAFCRGQVADVRLSENSWQRIHEMMAKGGITEEPVLNTVLVIAVLHALGKLPKFRAQLAPAAEGHKQVLAHVLDNCPKVLPSFCRLEGKYQRLARECLTRDFYMSQFLCAELVPASITTVKETAMISTKGDQHFLSVFLFCLFAEMAASMGPQSLDGSLYMTEAKWAEFECGWVAMNHVETESEQDIYDRILHTRAHNLGLSFKKSPESRAVVRLACLCRVTESWQAQKIQAAYDELESDLRQALTKYLNMDGLTQKPAYILSESSSFLENCLANGEVGLVPALKILLKVYNAAAKEFYGTSRAVVTVRLEQLAAFAKDFGGSVTFQDLPFDLDREGREFEATCVPKMWIPVTNQSVLNELKEKCQELSKELLRGGISERQFKARMMRAFPELSYFNTTAEAQRMQTQCAMLSVMWLVCGQHEAFIRQQAEEEQLSKQSWAWIQEWMKETCKLLTEEAVDATLTFMAIHALGKIGEFREELAPGFDIARHDLALEHILRTKPEVVPSFMRLSAKYRNLIIDSLSVDFQFSQFLQAENVPANLVVVKEKLAPHGDEGFAFFCFRIFVQMCGKLGNKSVQGSLFMTEQQFQRFRPGLDALQNLKTKEAGTAYNAFLLLQGSKALSRFASPEHQALARLLCLGSAADHAAGDALREAFDQLPAAERAQLTRWLIADGINARPGYVLCAAPDLLRNAQANPAVGLTAALRMMVRVQERCDVANAMFLRAATNKVYVHLNELSSWAQDAGPFAGEFHTARLEVRSEDLGDTRVFTVQVLRPKTKSGNGSSASDHKGGCLSCICSCLRGLVLMMTVLACLASAAAAGALWHFPEEETEDYVEEYGLGHSRKTIMHALGLLSVVLFFLLNLICCRRCCCISCEDCGSMRGCCSCRALACCTGGTPRAGTLACGYSRLESDLI